MHITGSATVAALAAAALVATAMPASAHPLVGSFTGTAITTGTWAPASPACGSTPCPVGNSWSFSSTTDVLADSTGVTIGSGRVSGSGWFAGWCGQSIGSGSLSLGTHIGSVIWWGAGGIIVLSGTMSGHIEIGAVMSHRAASGTGNRVTAPATAFDMVGTAYVV